MRRTLAQLYPTPTNKMMPRMRLTMILRASLTLGITILIVHLECCSTLIPEAGVDLDTVPVVAAVAATVMPEAMILGGPFLQEVAMVIQMTLILV